MESPSWSRVCGGISPMRKAQKEMQMTKTKIPNFGFSAFLKLICSNERPQRSAVRERHKPKKGSGYDYHRSLRTGIHKLASGSANARDVLSALSDIKKPAERRSAKRGVVRFLKWLKENPGKITFCSPVTFHSPAGLFQVRYEADFVLEINGRRTAIHIWNTQKPQLSKNQVMAALTLVQRNVVKESDTADDFAVLSLQDRQFFRWSDDPNGFSRAADAMMHQVDQLCSFARGEYGWPSHESPPEKPHPEI
jgi:hypothetical protein